MGGKLENHCRGVMTRKAPAGGTVDDRVGSSLFGFSTFSSKSLVFCEHKSGIRSSPSVHRSHVLCMPAQVLVQFCQA